MNTEERVIAALRHQQPDRVPVFIYFDPYNWDGKDASFASVMEATKRYADVIYDWNCPFGFFCNGAAPEIETIVEGNGTTRRVMHTPRGPIEAISAPNWQGSGMIKHWLATEEDALRLLSVPFVPPEPDLAQFLQTRQRLRGKAIAQVTLCDPICLVGMMVQPEDLAMWTIEHRAIIRELLDVGFERVMGLLKYLLERDAGPVYYLNGPEYALPPLMSPGDFEEFVVAYDTPLVERIRSYPGKYSIIHSHGRVNHFLERFAAIGMDGLNVLEPPPMGDVDLADAKRRIGRQVCLIGNIQYDDLARSSKEEVANMVRKTISAGSPGGGFILSPCAYPYEVPMPAKAAENIIEYLRVAHECGMY